MSCEPIEVNFEGCGGSYTTRKLTRKEMLQRLTVDQLKDCERVAVDDESYEAAADIRDELNRRNLNYTVTGLAEALKACIQNGMDL